MTIQTRNATEEDIPQLQSLAQSSTRLYSEDALQKAIASENMDLIVAEDAGTIIGLVRFGTPILEDCDCEDLKLIHALLVAPSHSWETIAQELVYSVEDSLNEDANIQRMAVYVDPARADWVRFYANHGFHHEEPEDEDGLWYMELLL